MYMDKVKYHVMTANSSNVYKAGHASFWDNKIFVLGGHMVHKRVKNDAKSCCNRKSCEIIKFAR